MEVAVPVWRRRIAPLLDTARLLWVVPAEGGPPMTRRELHRPPHSPPLWWLPPLGGEAPTLLCGAVSRPLEGLLRSAGVELFCGLAGPADEVIAAFFAGELPDPRYALPGCCCRGRWRHARGAFQRPGGRR